MTLIGWTQILLFCAIIAALARPLGGWLARRLGLTIRLDRQDNGANLPSREQA